MCLVEHAVSGWFLFLLLCECVCMCVCVYEREKVRKLVFDAQMRERESGVCVNGVCVSG